ncbi:MAG: glutamate racemase, partial [Treponema sp.]|nr:glutamate racemase [Treponema sp.]
MSKKNNNTKTVVFIDSGIGGLPYCVDFHKKNPDEEICYIADTKNFPYGPRDKDELAAILTALAEKLLITVNPKIIVLACNTATIAALPLLRTR